VILGDVCSLFLETCLDVFVCFVSFLGVFFAFVLFVVVLPVLPAQKQKTWGLVGFGQASLSYVDL